MHPIPPILVPTIARNLGLARWTLGQIRRYWPDHPEVFLCGVETEGALPLREDPADWMRVVASACGDLLEEGFLQVYLILDDHPPIARCHGIHLRQTLPLMAQELEATTMVTGGYGPLNRRKGRVVRWGRFHPERLPPSEPWKLPLHPALWNLSRLRDILNHLICKLPEEEHTPWAFERIGSNAISGGVRQDWLGASWRVNAWETSTREARSLHGLRDRLARLALRVSSLDALAFAGGSGKRAVGEALAGLLHPRIGPYPCFWSGVMKKGALNRDYVFYARFWGRPELIQDLEQTFASGSR